MMTTGSVPGPSRSLHSAGGLQLLSIAHTPAALCSCSPDCPVLSVPGLAVGLGPAVTLELASCSSCSALRTSQQRRIRHRLSRLQSLPADNAASSPNPSSAHFSHLRAQVQPFAPPPYRSASRRCSDRNQVADRAKRRRDFGRRNTCSQTLGGFPSVRRGNPVTPPD